MSRWLAWGALIGGLGCNGPQDTDVDTDVPVDTDVDTDATEVAWTDRRIETSATLYAVYTSGTGALVAGTGGHAWRFDGAASAVATGLDERIDLYGAWGSGEQAVLVGSDGTVVEVDGAEVVATEDLGTATFQDVDGTGPTDLTAVGLGGVYNKSAEGWTFQSLPASFRLAGVRAGATTDFAVGAEGAILTRTTGDWTQVTPVVNRDLNGVAGRADDDVWAVGDEGVILHWDGATWAEVDSGVETTLWSVWQADTGEVYIVGNNGVALVGGADGFEPLPTGIDGNLYGVHGAAADNVWAVGNRGQVLRYAPE